MVRYGNRGGRLLEESSAPLSGRQPDQPHPERLARHRLDAPTRELESGEGPQALRVLAQPSFKLASVSGLEHGPWYLAREGPVEKLARLPPERGWKRFNPLSQPCLGDSVTRRRPTPFEHRRVPAERMAGIAHVGIHPEELENAAQRGRSPVK